VHGKDKDRFMAEAAAPPPSPRRMVWLMLGLSALSIVGSVVALVFLARGGESRVEATITEDAQGRVAVRFTNRGTREGFLCGWVSVMCPGGAKQTVHICADDVTPGQQTTVATRLRTGGRAGCQISFVPNDTVDS
jgi:hypothetical protein